MANLLVTPALRTNDGFARRGFISTYADYADVLEAPRRAHEVVATQILATILNRNGVRIRHGALTHPLDLWTVLLSGSGAGRSTLVSLAEPILKAAGLGKIVRSEQWGSPQALYQQFSLNPSGLFVWGELSERLRMLNDKSFQAAKPWITDRYDNFSLPSDITYRETGKKSDTPPIVFTQAPRINILATSNDDWFFGNLSTEDSAGGFVPRWMLIRADGSARDVPTPPPLNHSLEPDLVKALEEVAKITGEADLSRILPDYEVWYTQTKRRFDSQPNKLLAHTYFSRHRVHVLKLAVIYEVSRSLCLQVSPVAWTKAKLEARQLEKTIFRLLPTGMSRTGYRVAEMEKMIESKAAEGILLSQLTRAFQHESRRDREDWLSTLCQTGKVLRFLTQRGWAPTLSIGARGFRGTISRSASLR